MIESFSGGRASESRGQIRIEKAFLLLLGALVGAAGVHWLTTCGGPPVQIIQTQPYEPPPPRVSDHVDGDSDQLRKRIDTLERRLASLPPSPSPDAGTNATGMSPQERATESRTIALSKYQKNLDDFDQELTDAQWAPTITALLQDEFATIARGTNLHFSTDVRCRATMCRARFTWPDYETAVKEYMMTDPSGPASQNCARQIILREPTDEKGPYTADLVLRCTRK